MLKNERNRLIQYFMSECDKSKIPFYFSEDGEPNIEDQPVVKPKKGTKTKKYALPKVPTAAELLGADPAELNPPSEDPMNDLPGDIPSPPEYNDGEEDSGSDGEEFEYDDGEGEFEYDDTPEEDPNAVPQEAPVDPNAPATPPPEDPNAMPPADPNAVPQEAPPEDPNAVPMEDPNAMPPPDPNAMPGGDPNAMPPGGDPNAMGDPNALGMEPEEEPLDPTQIGQVYILKKIYARLLAVDDNINQLSNPECDELKEKCAEAIELFQSVVTNFDQFKDKLGDIITLFQKLLTNFVNKLEELVPNGDEDNE